MLWVNLSAVVGGGHGVDGCIDNSCGGSGGGSLIIGRWQGTM